MRKIISGRRPSDEKDAFIFDVDVQNTSATSGAVQTLRLPIKPNPLGGGTLSFVVDWGDGSTDNVTSANAATLVHTYAGGTQLFTVKCTGYVRGWTFAQMTSGNDDACKVTKIRQWGTSWRGTEWGAFRDCINLGEVIATDGPIFENGSNGMRIFMRGCSSLKSITAFGTWDVSMITTMQSAFSQCSQLQGNAFSTAGNLSNWDVSKVASFQNMFYSCTAQNFKIFQITSSQSQTIDCQFMFFLCRAFDDAGATGNIGSWNTSKVINMDGMFMGCTAFNRDISGWNTSLVTNMRNMFNGFNQAGIFNQPIGSWNTANVQIMQSIFTFQNSFDQDLSNWDLNAINQYNAMFPEINSPTQGSFGLSTANYDALLVGWDNSGTFPNVPANSTLNFGSSQYSLTSPGNVVVNARNSLIAKWGGITDGGGV